MYPIVHLFATRPISHCENGTPPNPRIPLGTEAGAGSGFQVESDIPKVAFDLLSSFQTFHSIPRNVAFSRRRTLSLPRSGRPWPHARDPQRAGVLPRPRNAHYRRPRLEPASLYRRHWRVRSRRHAGKRISRKASILSENITDPSAPVKQL